MACNSLNSIPDMQKWVGIKLWFYFDNVPYLFNRNITYDNYKYILYI